MTVPAKLQMRDAPALIQKRAKGGRVFVPAGPVEPLALATAFSENAACADGLTFFGLFIPNVNQTDWASIHPGAKAELILPAPAFSKTIAKGQTRVLPLHYSAAWRYLVQAEFSVAIFHVNTPDSTGQCSLSLSADASPAFFNRAVFKLGIINHALPAVLGAPSIAYSAFDAVVEIDEAPLSIASPIASGDVEALAKNVSALVPDGATLQAGIGKLPAAVMACLYDRRDLSLYSGLIGEWALNLLEAGALREDAGALTAGIILGSSDLQARLKDHGGVRLLPINETHNAARLAEIPKFTSINAALEIDLFGQINCEFAGTRVLAGVGGAIDFLRGARASGGGKPIVVIQANGKDGQSRIVPRLLTPSVSIARSDAPILVTEYGSVDLEPLDSAARARAIIALAAPQHRDALEQAWRAQTSTGSMS